MPATAWNNAAHSLLERTLDDSANRRSLIPEAFLVAEECLITAVRIIKKLNINSFAIQHNLDIYAPFASTERLLMALVQAGANRQEMHELLRRHAMQAWQDVQSGQLNPLISNLAADSTLRQYLAADRITALLQVENYTGIAASQALRMVENIRTSV
jgi:adenylosuccinate lyase